MATAVQRDYEAEDLAWFLGEDVTPEQVRDALRKAGYELVPV